MAIPGTVPVGGIFAPTLETDEYPVSDPIYGIDGLRNVNSIEERNNIPELRRREGMIVGVTPEFGTPGLLTTTYYKLLPGPWTMDDSDWEEIDFGQNEGGLPAKHIFSGETWNVPTGKQNFIYGDLTVEGILNIEENVTVINGTVNIIGDGEITGPGNLNIVDFYTVPQIDNLFSNVYTAADNLFSNVYTAFDTNVNGTTNYIAKFTGSHSIGNSLIQDDGNTISINSVLDAKALINTRSSLACGYVYEFINNTAGTYVGARYILDSSSNSSEIRGLELLFNSPGPYIYPLRIQTGHQLEGQILKVVNSDGDMQLVDPPSSSTYYHNSLSGLEGGESTTPHYYHSNQPINRTDDVLFNSLVLGNLNTDGYVWDIAKTDNRTLATFQISDDNNGGIILSLKGRGTAGSPTGVVVDDKLLSFQGSGYDGTNWRIAPPAGIIISAGESWSDTSHATRLDFYIVKPNNTTGNFRIASALSSGLFEFYENVRIAGDAVVSGNMYVNGTEFISHSEIFEVIDNTIVVNKGEVGHGVTKGYAGIEVDRGLDEPYYFVFDENRDTFVLGISQILGSPGDPHLAALQVVATREDSPIDGGIALWNVAEKRFDTTNDWYSATQVDLIIEDFLIRAEYSNVTTDTVLAQIDPTEHAGAKIYYTIKSENSDDMTTGEFLVTWHNGNIMVSPDLNSEFGDTSNISIETEYWGTPGVISVFANIHDPGIVIPWNINIRINLI